MYIFKMFLTLALVFGSLFEVALSEAIPVMVWDAKRPSTSVLPGLELVKPVTFTRLMEQHLHRGVPLLAFVEENLSLEDFTLHDENGNSPLAQVAKLGDNSDEGLSYLPFVEDPVDVIKELPGANVRQSSLEELSVDRKIELSRGDVLIVTLNDAKEEESRFEMLKRHGESIAKICKQLSETNNDVVAVITAFKRSWRSGEHLHGNRLIRDTTKAEESPNGGGVYNNSHAIMYLEKPAIFVDGETQKILEGYSFTSEEIINKNTLILTYSKDPADVQVKFEILFAEGYWILYNLTLTSGAEVVVFKVTDVFALDDFSYHCNQTILYEIKDDKKDDKLRYLQLPGFQFQPSLEEFKALTFGDPYDCVNFMTIPILSGLFVTFILALIMTFGLTTIMDIKTMDRFDDPKGKTITINASE